MATDIFIKTCNHDAAYHEYCLRSIEKFCTGFRNTVVVPGEHRKGYLHQQVVKMYADKHADAEQLLILDSDCLFLEPVTPESFCVDGKPVWVITPYNDEMRAHPGTAAWFKVMTKFFWQEPTHEYMRRQPFVFPAYVLPMLRAFCVTKHGRTLEQYIMESEAFSEYNVLGMFCHLFLKDRFHWMDSTVELPKLLVRQFWSHDPLEKNLPEILSVLNK